MFILGFFVGLLTGLLVAILVVVTIIFLRSPIEKIINLGEKQIKTHAPHPKGYVVEATSLEEREREAIIKENSKHGRSTKVADLI